MKVTIRDYHDVDYDAVRHVWELCGLEVDDPADSREGMTRFRARNARFCLVAQEEGTDSRICGTVMGGYDGRRLWVHHLAVAPRFQGKGLGRRLMAALEQRAVSAGIAGLNLLVAESNRAVVGFYRHLGYRELSGLTTHRKWLSEASGHRSATADS